MYPNNNHPFPAAPAPVPPKKGKGMKIALGVAGSLAALLVVGAIAGKGEDESRRAVSVGKTLDTPASISLDASEAPAPTTAQAAPATPAGPKTRFGKGVYVAGEDVAPGTYSTAGSSYCYWEKIHAKGSTSFDNIIENANVDADDYLSLAPGEIVRVKGTCSFALAE